MDNTNSEDVNARYGAASAARAQFRDQEQRRNVLIAQAIRFSAPTYDRPGSVPQQIYDRVARAFQYARYRNAAGLKDVSLEAILRPYANKQGGLTVADCARLFLALEAGLAPGSAAGDAAAKAPDGSGRATALKRQAADRRLRAARFVLAASAGKSGPDSRLDLSTGLDVIARETKAASDFGVTASDSAAPGTGKVIRGAAGKGTISKAANRQIEKVETLLDVVSKGNGAEGPSSSGRVWEAAALLRLVQRRGVPLGNATIRLQDLRADLAPRVARALGQARD